MKRLIPCYSPSFFVPEPIPIPHPRQAGRGWSSDLCSMMIRSPGCPGHASKCQPGAVNRLYHQHESSKLRTVGSDTLLEIVQHNTPIHTQYLTHSPPWLQKDETNPSCMR